MRTSDIILSLLVIVIIAVFPHLGLLPGFSYAVPILLVVWLSLKQFRERFSNLMFRWKGLSWHAAFTGVLAGILLFSFLQLAFWPVLDSALNFEESDADIYRFLKESPLTFGITLAMGWLIGGVYEEIVFHGFMFTRFEKMLPGKNPTLVAFLLTNIIFGAYHLQLGYPGAVNALLAGMAYNGIAIYFNRNLWYAIICHGTYNTLTITFIYLEYI